MSIPRKFDRTLDGDFRTYDRAVIADRAANCETFQRLRPRSFEVVPGGFSQTMKDSE